jgi:GNAT superfamily N-acetyltransferase
VNVETVDVTDIYAVRRAVLRTGTPTDNIDWAGDRDPDTRHLAIRDDAGEVIAISTWAPRPLPDEAGTPGIQLRGMAVSPDHQRRGLGGALIAAGVADARQRGAQLVWANARDTALPFYVANGFEVVGDGFVAKDTQLPHHRVVRHL